MHDRAALKELPQSIQAEGWWHTCLTRQRDGITGKKRTLGFPFASEGWLDPGIAPRKGEAWWPYEQIAYWLDGAIRCALLLNDEQLAELPRTQLRQLMHDQQSDGWIGPDILRTFHPQTNKTPRWAHNVLFRAFWAEYQMGDQEIAEKLEEFYLNDDYDYHHHRDSTHIEHLVQLGLLRNEPQLIAKAETAYQRLIMHDHSRELEHDHLCSDQQIHAHGPTTGEMIKLGAILWRATGNEAYLAASRNAFRKLDRDQMLCDGAPSGSEHLRGKNPRDSHETCVVVDYCWAAGHMLLATGEAEWADRIERALFNAGMGSVLSDFKALQYFSSPNQVISDETSGHNAYWRGGRGMCYLPNAVTEYCTGNVNRLVPNFIWRSWLQRADGSLAVACYGPSTWSGPVNANGGIATIKQSTAYPFEDTVRFDITTERPTRVTMALRIPGWCTGARINGDHIASDDSSGWYTWSEVVNGHVSFSLHLHSQVRSERWPEGGISIQRGPLTFALPVEQKRQVLEENDSTAALPAWAHTPANRDWAQAFDPEHLNEVQVVHRPVAGHPWDQDSCPIALELPLRAVADWDLQHLDGFERWQGNGVEPLPPEEASGLMLKQS
jgi:hypothetical protein